MKEPEDFEQIGPGLRQFGLNSGYGVWLLGPEQEGTVNLRVMTEREIEGEISKRTSARF